MKIVLLIFLIPTAPAWSVEFLVHDRGTPVDSAMIDVIQGVSLGKHNSPPSLAKMTQRAQSFDPHVLLINAGTEVTFPNEANVLHHVYSFSKARAFELKLYKGSAQSAQS